MTSVRRPSQARLWQLAGCWVLLSPWLTSCSFLVPLDGIFCEDKMPCAPADGAALDGPIGSTGDAKAQDAPPAAAGFQVKYATSELDDASRRIRIEVQIFNHTAQDVALSRLQLRYHFTIDGQKPAFLCSTVNGAPPSSCANLIGNIERQTQPSPWADHHLSVRFAEEAGTLEGFGRSTGLMKLAILSTDNDFIQGNDHSFGGITGEPQVWANITLYLDGQLVFGHEPSATPSAAEGAARALTTGF